MEQNNLQQFHQKLKNQYPHLKTSQQSSQTQADTDRNSHRLHLKLALFMIILLSLVSAYAYYHIKTSDQKLTNKLTTKLGFVQISPTSQPLAPSTEPTTAPTKSDQNKNKKSAPQPTTPQNGNKNNNPPLFKKKLFDAKESFAYNRLYPPEILNLKDHELVEISCSKDYAQQPSGKYISYSNREKTELTDPRIKNHLEQNPLDVTEISWCNDHYNHILITYELHRGEYNHENEIHFSYLNQDNTIDLPATVFSEGFPYFTCSQPLALTKENILYYVCQGGNEALSRKSIYKINLTSRETKKIYQCQSKSNQTQDQATVNCSSF